MRTIVHLLALLIGAAMLYRGFAEGLPAQPLTAKESGFVSAFGFGMLLTLVGLRHFGLRVMLGEDVPLGGLMAVLVIVLAGAVTAGLVAWRGRDSSSECDAMAEHVHALVVARDPSAGARFEEARPKILERCERLTSAQRKCSMTATSVEQLQHCP